MKLTEIPLTDMYAGKSWFVSFPEGGDPNNPEVQEEDHFAEGDLGLFSGILKFADGSNHPAVVLKTFEHAGAQIAIFIYTRMGWMNLESPGIMRVLGKYSHDMFPYDVYLANPADADQEIADKDAHRRYFNESIEALKQIKYEPFGPTTKKRILGP